jgi:hypothetical protein
MHESSEEQVLFMLAGVNFQLPLGWVQCEQREVVNVVQPSEQASFLPVISSRSNGLTLQISIPIRGKLTNQISLLKGYLINYSEIWPTLKYTSNLLTSRLPFTNLSLPSSPPFIVSYMGAQNYLLGGILTSFKSSYNPNLWIDEWQIQLDGMSLSMLRSGMAFVDNKIGITKDLSPRLALASSGLYEAA